MGLVRVSRPGVWWRPISRRIGTWYDGIPRPSRSRQTGGSGQVDMAADIDTGVFIVGAGPVGLTLAIDLAQRGVDEVVAETRHAGELPSVKCNQVAARSMEIY